MIEIIQCHVLDHVILIGKIVAIVMLAWITIGRGNGGNRVVCPIVGSFSNLCSVTQRSRRPWTVSAISGLTMLGIVARRRRPVLRRRMIAMMRHSEKSVLGIDELSVDCRKEEGIRRLGSLLSTRET